ncbi:MAG: ABC transporter permease [Pyrinomonadaceae bacterium]
MHLMKDSGEDEPERELVSRAASIESGKPNIAAISAQGAHSVVIEPSAAWSPLNLRDLWSYRELLVFLVWRDIKVRYKQTAMGAAWAIVQPLLTMLVFAFFFGRFVRVPSDNIPYPIFAYAGLLPWTFFANAVVNGSNSLVANSNLITKVYFPRLLIPAAAVGAGLLDFAIASVIFIGMAIYYGITLTWSLALLPGLIVLLMLLALGIGLWLSALTVKYRDVRHALPFAVQLLMFISPVIYPASILPGKWRSALMLNPMTGIIEGFRSSLTGRAIETQSLYIAAALTLVLLVCAAYSFRRIEQSFADII